MVFPSQGIIMPQPPCLEAALEYLARGWSAIALCPPDHSKVAGEHEKTCNSPGKAPLWPWKEYQERLAKPEQLQLWWNRNEKSNVGVVMGPVSGIIGVDIDSNDGFALLANICGGAIPNTFQFSTPGGQDHHRLFFKYPDVEIPTRSVKLNGHEAIRIQGKGAQTVMPPSIHPSGPTYGWECFEDIPLLDMPAPLIAYLQRPPEASAPSPIHRARAYLAKCDPCVSGSGGHNQAFNVACKLMHGFGLAEAAALGLLMEPGGYNARCVPPWTERDWTHKLADALTKGHSVSLLNGEHHDTKKNYYRSPAPASRPDPKRITSP
jgi:hypothetical protein